VTTPDPRDEIWRRAEIESPCVKVCVIQPEARLCIGCHRSIEEIAGWSRLTAQERRAIMAELPGRKPLLARRRGGRAGRMSAG
jgi:predicted Fe-S protein YdhL (DUF1289 family)